MFAQNKKILGAVGVDTVAVALIALLVVKGFIPSRVVPIVSFCLFWANFVFFRAVTLSKEQKRSNGVNGNWKFLALMTTAGVYFAGALWGITLWINEHEMYGLLGTAFSTCFGVFCVHKAERDQLTRKG